MKLCIKCGQLKPLEKFNFRNRQLNKRQRQCQDCTRAATMAAYYRRYSYYRGEIKKWRRQYVKRSMQYLFDYFKSHPCVDCGANDPIILQFDHVRGKKVLAVGTLALGGYSMKSILTEIEKCEVRCANCHARKTARERGYQRYLVTQSSVRAISN